MLSADYVVVGSGLTGSTIARTLADEGGEVIVLDRREHLGGNVHDQLHECGVRWHTYGPHYFRTSSERIWEYVQRFGEFYKHEAKVVTQIEGKLYRWPLKTTDKHLKEKAIDGYNLKMWGTKNPPFEVKQRVEDRNDDSDPRLKTSKWQGLPKEGYAAWMMKMLEGIDCYKMDYTHEKHSVRARKKLIFTGPIDELYGFEYGRLDYRGQNRRLLWFDEPLSRPVAQVNRPGPEVLFIRSIAWNMLAEKVDFNSGSLITYEYPTTPDDPNNYEYPYNDEPNRALYARYKARANADEKLVVCGRLGEFKYLDMDQAIARAMLLGNQLLKEQP